MNWTQELAHTLRSGTGETSKGTACYFVKLTERTGIKLYLTPMERDASWTGQSIGYENGIALKPGECVEIEGLEIPEADAPRWWRPDLRTTTPRILYGYLTEVASYVGQSGGDAVDLLQDCYDLGFSLMCDLCYDNVGFTEDGQPVVLDWDGRFMAPGVLTRAEREEIVKNYDWDEYWLDSNQE